MEESTGSESENLDNLTIGSLKKSNLRKRPLSPSIPDRVEWTDDDGDDIPVQTASSAARAKNAVKGGKKYQPRRRGRPLKTHRQDSGRQTTLTGGVLRSGGCRTATDDDEADDAQANDVPDYVRARRALLDADPSASLRVPPDSAALVADITPHMTRPVFSASSGVRPSREFADVDLQESGGVVPAPVAQYLRDYQLEGVRFLHRLFVWQIGGILGDDMGLGKTVQVAAFLATAFGKSGDERDQHRMRRMRAACRSEADGGVPLWYPRVLVICPASLIHNWRDELNRWGWWHVDVFHGNPTQKADVLQTARNGRLEIMITTYDTYSNNRSSVNLVDWDAVIADECHRIKEQSSNTTRAMAEVNALCRIGLTGTGIQNNYDELWTLLNWTNPGRFGSHSQWQTAITRPLVVGQSHDATLAEILAARRTARRLVENVLPPFFLRRLKTLLADQLPRKRDRIVFCPLTSLQERAYEGFLRSDVVKCIVNAHKLCTCGSNKRQGNCCNRKVPDGRLRVSCIFPSMMTLQKLANHLALLLPISSDSCEKQSVEMAALRECLPDTWEQMYKAREAMQTLANPEFCGKWKILKELLRMWYADGDKVLVFSHSVRLLNILNHLLTNTSYTVSYIDGSVSYDERARTVAAFNTDPHQFVFLISTRAGGVGLNITSANRVVIFDPHWNPALDLQAQDRAYRIGQTRDVDVYRLISAGTVEEIVYARQIYKQQQANIGYSASAEPRYFKGVQHDDDRKGEIFGLQNIFSYRKDQLVLKDIVHNTNVAEAKVQLNLMDIDVQQVAADAEKTFKFEDPAEDNAISQVADIFRGHAKAKNSRAAKQPDADGTAEPKADPIHALLRAAGVAYTHENSSIIGPSHIEDTLARAPANPSTSGAPPWAPLNDVVERRAARTRTGLQRAHFVYNPPEDVQVRQFCQMARDLGFADATAFALVVENGSVEQRRAFLAEFYRKRRERLFGGHSGKGIEDQETREGEEQQDQRDDSDNEERDKQEEDDTADEDADSLATWLGGTDEYVSSNTCAQSPDRELPSCSEPGFVSEDEL